MIQPGLLREGFELVRRKQLDVTNDVSIVEALGRPVKVTTGSYTNIKVVASMRKYGHSHLCFQDILSAQFATILGRASVACHLNWPGMLLDIYVPAGTHV